MNVERTEYTVRVHDENGSLWAEVVELPGCFAAGESEAELRVAVVEAISLYLGQSPMDVEWGPATDKVEEHRILLNA